VAAVILALRAVADVIVGAVQVPWFLGLGRDKDTDECCQQNRRQRPGASQLVA